MKRIFLSILLISIFCCTGYATARESQPQNHTTETSNTLIESISNLTNELNNNQEDIDASTQTLLQEEIKHTTGDNKTEKAKNSNFMIKLFYIIIILIALLAIIMIYNRHNKRIVRYNQIVEYAEKQAKGLGTEVHVTRISRLPEELKRQLKLNKYVFKYLYGFNEDATIIAMATNNNGDVIDKQVFCGHVIDEELSVLLASNNIITIDLKK